MRTCVQCQSPISEGARVCTNCHALQPARNAEARFASGLAIAGPSSRFVLDKKLGDGGMAIVWRAWEFFAPGDPRGTGPQLVALKIMRTQAGLGEQLHHFFMQEAAALRALSHPNIVGLSELFEDRDPSGDRVILALEYVDGETLDSLIARHIARATLAGAGGLPGLPFLRAWHYFQQLLGALASAHALGIVHRDVKPQNVLLRRDGLVKLTDFGIAKVAQKKTQSLSIANEGAPGTAAYMSPEQVLSRTIDGRSDLYSAAIVLYEMLSGRLPFPTADRSEFLVRQDQVEKPAPPIRTYLPHAPPILDALFARALSKDPGHRFQDAFSLGEAFRSAFGMPQSDEWLAQGELARAAATSVATEPNRQAKVATLRQFLAVRYQTAPLTARK